MSESSSFKSSSVQRGLRGKMQDYKLLIKFNLSFMVVFSALISYLLAPKVKEYDLVSILLFFLGGMLVTGPGVEDFSNPDTADLLRKSRYLMPSGLLECDLEELWWLGDTHNRERVPLPWID